MFGSLNFKFAICVSGRRSLKMQSTMTGECHCGAVTYRLRSASLLTYVCHCGNCQKRSGSAFGMGMVIPIDDIEIEGELSCWERVSDAGNKNPRYSCAACLSPLFRSDRGKSSEINSVMRRPHDLANSRDILDMSRLFLVEPDLRG
jgi:hypothetical protein